MLLSEWPMDMPEGKSAVLLIDVVGLMPLWIVREVDLGYNPYI